MEKLKKVMERMQNDKQEGTFPWTIDPKEEAKLNEKLRNVLKLNIEAKKAGAEG